MNLYLLGKFEMKGSPPQVLLEHGVWQKMGRRKLSSTFCNSIVLHIGLDIYYLAFVCYLHHQFFNHHRYRADEILIPVLLQALSVSCKCIVLK